MGRLRSALRACALDHPDPAVVLGKLDRKTSHFERATMATVVYAVIGTVTHRPPTDDVESVAIRHSG